MEDSDQHYLGKIAQKAIIEKHANILVCRGIGDSVWEFPGGRLHMDEMPQEGLVREIREELGIHITVLEPIHVSRSFHGKANVWQIIIGYKASISGSGTIIPDPGEVEDYTWVTREELKDLPMFEDCREIADIYLGVPSKRRE